MITTVAKFIKQIFIPRSEFIEDEIESVIDESVDCKELTNQELAYTGVPAPVMTPIDEWFVDSNVEPVKTEKQLTHEEMLEEAERREKENVQNNEPQDIHQKMYEMATKNWTTVKEFQGGSENFQDGWNSGTGLGQFR